MTAFVIATLATWRLSSLMYREDGPFSVFVRLRYAVGSTHSKTLIEALNCLWCASVYVGLAVALVWLYGRPLTEIVGTGLALSMAAIVLDECLMTVQAIQRSQSRDRDKA